MLTGTDITHRLWNYDLTALYKSIIIIYYYENWKVIYLNANFNTTRRHSAAEYRTISGGSKISKEGDRGVSHPHWWSGLCLLPRKISCMNLDLCYVVCMVNFRIILSIAMTAF